MLISYCRQMSNMQWFQMEQSYTSGFWKSHLTSAKHSITTNPASQPSPWDKHHCFTDKHFSNPKEDLKRYFRHLSIAQKLSLKPVLPPAFWRGQRTRQCSTTSSSSGKSPLTEMLFMPLCCSTECHDSSWGSGPWQWMHACWAVRLKYIWQWPYGTLKSPSYLVSSLNFDLL